MTAHCPTRTPRGARIGSACVALTLLAAVSAVSPPIAGAHDAQAEYQATAMPATLAVKGHGYGHGRGLGQYGALGYATGRSGGPWTYSTILEHFYGGTTAGQINDNPLVAVLLKARAGQPMTVYRETGLQVAGLAGQPQAVRVTVRPDGQFDVEVGTSCLAFTADPPVQLASPVRVDVVPDTGTKVLRLCKTDGSAVAYKGSLIAHAKTARNLGQDVVNLVMMDDYMKGVVPRESPASWGDSEGGLGMAALRAQAVAARSYAAAGDTRWGDLHSAFGARATTCDDQYCQVYGGLADISPSGGVTYRTDPRTDRAVDETAGEVRMKGSAIARTEFSSSTGGWTAGGAFPAVVDVGDAISSNPNHAWDISMERSKIESAYGLGTLTGVQVLDRNDLGDMGGRVVKIRLTGSDKTVEVSGNALRSKLGLKSDWFDIGAPPPPTAQARSIDTACPPGSASGTFTDVPADSPHLRAIDCVAGREIAQGTGEGQFSPAKTVTRAQMATFVARTILAAGGTLPDSPEDAFIDDLGSVHEHAINQLAAVGVVNGVGPKMYGPQRDIDRAQVAAILARGLVHLGVPLGDSPIDYFTDDDGSTHELRINQLAGEGVVTGTSGRLYSPSASTRRDQMAALVARALDRALSG